MSANAATPEAVSYAINKALAATKNADPDFSDMVFEYDAVNRGFKITQSATPITAISVVAGSAAAADVFNVAQSTGEGDTGTQLLPLDTEPDILLMRGVIPNGVALSLSDQRYGISVEYSDGQFLFKSGETGDQSSIEITLNTETVTEGEETTEVLTAASQFASDLLGLTATQAVAAQYSQVNNVPTLRGQGSQPAFVTGNAMGVDATESFSVTAANRNLTVIVDGISSQINLTEGQYSIGTFTKHLQDQINLMADSLGRSVSGLRLTTMKRKAPLQLWVQLPVRIHSSKLPAMATGG